jgi:hypothetical protein
MWRRKKTLARLHEELRTIALFDRIHDYDPHPNRSGRDAHALRQLRRSQIIVEIENLKTTKPMLREQTGMGSAALLLTAAGYVLYTLLR